MKRIGLRLLAAFVLIMGVAGAASAQSYPNRPVRLIVPYLAGGGSDISTRIIAEALGTRLGQPVIVENKPGAGSSLGIDYVVKSAGDGYTLLQAAGDGTTIMSAVKPDMPYKIPDDLSWISRTVSSPYAVAVNANLPFKTFADLIAYAKANPGKLRYGSPGIGTGGHLSAVLLEKHAGIEMKHIVYKGSAQVATDLAGGFIDLSMVPPASIKGQVESGKVIILGHTGEKRHPAMPDAPTMTELGLPGVTVLSWYGLMGPSSMNPALLDRLRSAVSEVLKDPAVIERLTTIGLLPDPLGGDQFRAYVLDELKKWQAIAKSENIVIQE